VRKIRCKNRATKTSKNQVTSNAGIQLQIGVR